MLESLWLYGASDFLGEFFFHQSFGRNLKKRRKKIAWNPFLALLDGETWLAYFGVCIKQKIAVTFLSLSLSSRSLSSLSHFPLLHVISLTLSFSTFFLLTGAFIILPNFAFKFLGGHKTLYFATIPCFDIFQQKCSNITQKVGRVWLRGAACT